MRKSYTIFYTDNKGMHPGTSLGFLHEYPTFEAAEQAIDQMYLGGYVFTIWPIYVCYQ